MNRQNINQTPQMSQATIPTSSGILRREYARHNITNGGRGCGTSKQMRLSRRGDAETAGMHWIDRKVCGDLSTHIALGDLRTLDPVYTIGSGGRGVHESDDSDTRVPWSWGGAGVGALGGAVGGAIIGGLIGGLPGAVIGAGIGAIGGAVAGGLIGGAVASVVPRAISRTQVDRDTPSLGPTYYGSVFKHTLSTTGGTITPDVTIAEAVGVTRDDFATGFAGVPLGTLTWGPGGTAPLSGNDMFDNIGTNNINVTNFLPSPPKPGLPAIMETPQELHYRIGTGSWTKFADVPMVVTLRAKVGGSYEVETRNNGVPSLQNYTGPT